ncbi:uncharacterized protein SAPINGB_P005929 [Magnusiomyces paraingens]|uniref:VPS9 domain-containing protein n=1 Tax=Magnusiomyces paraingens TaxID=2606893 RepID=A0A5E8C9B3_9ASCO|nr:uncharacterized protein SAPINGB_P005929 [Saprochaete ingens]VVT57886.1 unnamed protein product [Saprochaete ingens]
MAPVNQPPSSSPYANLFLHTLFFNPEPTPIVRKLRTYFQDPGRFARNVIVVPPLILEWAVDSDSHQPFTDIIATNEDFIASHVLIIPPDSKSTDRSRRLLTFNNKTIFSFKGFLQTNAGFKIHFNSKVLNEYIITPSSPYLPADSQFVVYEVAYPLVGRPTFPSLSSIDLTLTPSQQEQFDLQLIPPPEYFGVDLDKIKGDLKTRRDYKLLPIVYTKDISKADLELLQIINTFSIDAVSSTQNLVNLYNTTIEESMKAFSSVGSSTLNKIINETGLSSQDIGQMVGEYVETQLHQQFWEKTTQLHQKKDAVIADLCWEMKDISVEQLDIPVSDMTVLFDLDDLVTQAVKLFSSLTSVSSVAEKEKVLLSVVQILSNGTPDRAITAEKDLHHVTKCSVHYNMELSHNHKLKNSMSADTFVSLMIMVIVRSEMVNIHSLLFYIRKFSFNEVEMGHLGYALSTLEAAAYHISNHGKKIAKLSHLNKRFFECLPSPSQTKEFIETLRHNKPKYWKSVIRSRSHNNLTALTTVLQELAKNGTFVDEILEFLNYLFDLQDDNGDEVFDIGFVIGDRDSQGSSLFLLALDTEDADVIFSVLGKIDPLNDCEMAQYFARVNNMKRSVGHYIFHAHWLIPEIGHLVDWEQRDLAGQSPLFALCRCYDHPNYSDLVEFSLKAWEKSPKSQKPLNLMAHQDLKDNTLLHIVKSPEAVKHLLKYESIDVNWPNEAGFSPLMVYSKFSRLEALQVLLQDERVNKLQESANGTNALEIAKESDTIRYLESEYIPEEDRSMSLTAVMTMSLSPGNGFNGGASDTATCVLRTSLSKGRLYFIITTGKRGDPGSVISVRRSFDDFKFLAKWLGYENPYSWVPPLPVPSGGSGPKVLHGKTVYQLFHEIQTRLNVFLRTLMAHPTFGAHELLWEFVLVQDISRDSVIERCRRKLQNAQESQMEKEAAAASLSSVSSSASLSSLSPSSISVVTPVTKSGGAEEEEEEEEGEEEEGEEEQGENGKVSSSGGPRATRPGGPLGRTWSISSVSSDTGEEEEGERRAGEREEELKQTLLARNQKTQATLREEKAQRERQQRKQGGGAGSAVFFYRSEDLEPISYFLEYAQEQLTGLGQSTEALHQGAQKMCLAVDSHNEAVEEFFKMISRFAGVMSGSSSGSSGSSGGGGGGGGGGVDGEDGHEVTRRKTAMLGLEYPRQAYSELSVSLNSLAQIVESGARTLAAPLAMVSQLGERETALGVLHRQAEKLAGGAGEGNEGSGGSRSPWAALSAGMSRGLMFEEKRVREMNETNDRIYVCQNEINRLSTDIHRYHETLASEVGALLTVHEAELRRHIRTFSDHVLHSHKTSLDRLQRVRREILDERK